MYLIILAHILIAIFFVRWLIKNDRGAKEPRSGYKAAIGFGLLALIVLLFFNPFHNEDTIQQLLEGPVDLQMAFFTALTVGITEEVAKCIPLGLYLWKKSYFNETTDGLFYFGITGMVFGVIESILYTVGMGAATGIARILFTPFLHVGMSMWFGYFLARRKVRGTGSGMVVVGLLLAIGLHTLYDFGAFSRNLWLVLLSLALATALNIGVFQLYKRSRAEDQALQLSAEGQNAFCRQCGKPNPHHTLYCEYCGKRT